VADTEHQEAAPDFAAIETKVAEIGESVKGLGKLAERLDRLEAKANRPGAARDAQPEAAEERKAWLAYIRKGRQADDLDLKVLTVANDVSAGYLAPAEVSREFIADLTELSPIRQYATVRQSLAPEVKYPRRLSGTNAKWEGEIEEAEESSLTFGQTTIASHRLTTFVELSNSLIMGSDGLAEAEVRRAFAEDFAMKEGAAFVNGTGVKQPEGIMVAPGVPEVLNGHATTLNPDSLISLYYALPAQYRARAVWVKNGSTAPVIRKMKDTAGQYIWQPGLQAGEPATLLGRPVVEAPDMPEMASGAFPIAFGDLGTAYRIIDRQQLATLTDPYRKAEFAITRIYGTRWVGAGVVQPKALRKLKMATS
jgi:HK97 family phage major capsid protein